MHHRAPRPADTAPHHPLLHAEPHLADPDERRRHPGGRRPIHRKDHHVSTNQARRPRRGVALLTAAATIAAAALGTSALFTEREVVADNDFTAGWMDLSAGTQTSAITAANMAPGDSILEPLVLTNGGTVDLTWTASVSLGTGGTLGQALQVVTAPATDAAQCAPDRFLEVVSSDPSIRPVNPTQANITPARVMPAGEQTTVCLVVMLPSGTPTEYAGSDAELIWTFDATQATGPAAPAPEPATAAVMALTYDLAAPGCTTREVTLPVDQVTAGTVDWGDGTTSELTRNVTHTYATTGVQTITIDGQFGQYGDGPDGAYVEGSATHPSNACLISVDRWDDETGTTMLAGAFNGAANLTAVPEIPTGVTNTAYAFFGTERFAGDLSAWDVSAVTDMTAMFSGRANPSGMEGWDVSKVTAMDRMFQYNTAFNRDLSAWDTSSLLTYDAFDEFTMSWTLPKPVLAWQ